MSKKYWCLFLLIVTSLQISAQESREPMQTLLDKVKDNKLWMTDRLVALHDLLADEQNSAEVLSRELSGLAITHPDFPSALAKDMEERCILGENGVEICYILEKMMHLQIPWAKEVYVPFLKINALQSTAYHRLVWSLKRMDIATADYIVPRLVLALHDKNYFVRCNSIVTLGKIGAKASAAIPHLLQIFDDDQDDTIRTHAADSLAAISTNAEMIMPHLLKALHDPNERVRERVTGILGNVNFDASSAIPDLIQMLADQKSSSMASFPLGRIGSKAVPALIQVIREKQSTWSTDSAIQVLGEIGPQASAAIPHLIPFLEPEDKSHRKTVINALSQMGPRASVAVPYLIPLLNIEDQDIKKATINALMKIGSQASIAVPHLIPLLDTEDQGLRKATIDALIKIGPQAAVAVPHLIPLLNTEDQDIRKATIDALGKIGPQAAAAVPHLIFLLEKEDSDKILAALEKIGPAAFPHLVLLLPRLSSQLKKDVTWSFKSFGSQAIPVLIQLLNDPDSEIRERAAFGLQKMGSPAGSAVPVLIQLLKDPSESVKISAIEALGRIGSASTDAVPHIASFITNSDLNMKKAVFIALGRIAGNTPAEVVALLKQNLHNEDAEMRLAAAFALLRLGQEEIARAAFITELRRSNESQVKIFTYRDRPEDSDEDSDEDYVEKKGSYNRANAFYKEAEFLEELGPQAAFALPLLKKLIQFSRYSHDVVFRDVATLALARIGAKSPQAIPFLMQSLDDENENVRLAAAFALYSQSANEALQKTLLATFDDRKNDWVIDIAVQLLGELGPQASFAVPALKKFKAKYRYDRDYTYLVNKSLQNIDPGANGADESDE